MENILKKPNQIKKNPTKQKKAAYEVQYFIWKLHNENVLFYEQHLTQA